MCGIYGQIYSAHAKRPDPLIPLAQIGKRGPDLSGYSDVACRHFRVLLAHSRLIILDPDKRSSQPMHFNGLDWQIIYNGEIYNFIELRSELIALGWSFSTQSDTEVLLKAWSQWGLDALPRLNGMFAFCVFNQSSGEIFLIRDRFGIKPLLWGRTPSNGLVFSSSLASVADATSSSVDIDSCAFGLKYGVYEGPDIDSPFHGVQEVPPGTWVKIQINNDLSSANDSLVLSNGKWYDLNESVQRKQELVSEFSDDDLLAYSQEILESAVKIRLRSDVELAVSLSGGLDSSTVASLANKQVSGLEGFTYGSNKDCRSEGPIVERFANDLNILPHYIWPDMNSGELDKLLERTFMCQEAPFPGLSVMAQNELFRDVHSSGFKVLLGGQGGDEIFAGYRKFFVVATRHALHKRNIFDSLSLLYSLGLVLLNEVGSAKIYLQALKRYNKTTKNSFALLDWVPREANLWGEKDGSLSERQVADVMRWSIPSLLRYEDRNSMGHSVESRLPFMDYRLVELALALPTRLKIANGFGKYALRNIVNGLVPDFIRLNRTKRGFDVTQDWIKSGLGSSLRSRIFSSRDVLNKHLRTGVDLDRCLSDRALAANKNLLNEALMLAWLIKPIRLYGNEGVCL